MAAFAEGGGIPFRPRVAQGIDPDALVAPGSAQESRSGFLGNPESDLHTYRPNSLKRQATDLRIRSPHTRVD